MSDYSSFFYILMIVAGIALLIWYFVNSGKSRKRDETAHRILSGPTPDEPLGGAVSNSSVAGSASVPDRIIGNTVHSIYCFDVISGRKAGNVWVCRDCETENRDSSDTCAICGAPK